MKNHFHTAFAFAVAIVASSGLAHADDVVYLKNGGRLRGVVMEEQPGQGDSLLLTAKHRVATPANWKQGEEVILAGSVTDDEAKKLYPQGYKTPKPYIRVVPQPH